MDVDQPSIDLSLTIALKSLQEARLDLSGVPLSGDDLREIDDLRGAVIRTLLADADLCGLNLAGVILVGQPAQCKLKWSELKWCKNG